MLIGELIRKNRSCRRFYENKSIETNELKDLINLARLSASGGNLQPLKYIISNTPERNEFVFQHLAWAAYLKNWKGPKEGERPSAYIVMLGDTTIAKDFAYDAGIACQSILLGAREAGLAGCILGSINRERLRNDLEIEQHLKILLVLALGRPKEQIVIESLGPTGSIQYWRDEKGIHHVPKRDLNEIIIK